jgi:hypothetical protein
LNFQVDLDHNESGKSPGPGQLMWDPTGISPSNLDVYLKEARTHIKNQHDHNTFYISMPTDEIPPNEHDREQLMTLLHESNYIPSIAISEIQGKSFIGDQGNWSEEDIEIFEEGMKEFPKEFRKIRSIYLPHKTISEIVEFFYKWKVSSRFQTWEESRTQTQFDYFPSCQNRSLPVYLFDADSGTSESEDADDIDGDTEVDNDHDGELEPSMKRCRPDDVIDIPSSSKKRRVGISDDFLVSGSDPEESYWNRDFESTLSVQYPTDVTNCNSRIDPPGPPISSITDDFSPDRDSLSSWELETFVSDTSAGSVQSLPLWLDDTFT